MGRVAADVPGAPSVHGARGCSAASLMLAALLPQRDAAKKAKDWATADAIRQRVAAAGWKIVDTPQGARLEKA